MARTRFIYEVEVFADEDEAGDIERALDKALNNWAESGWEQTDASEAPLESEGNGDDKD